MNALKEDGNWGVQSKKALQTMLNQSGISHLTVDGGCGKYTKAALQRYINRETGSHLTVDGNFGPYTKKALQRMLNASGVSNLTVDGGWGFYTKRAFQRYINIKLGLKPKPEPQPQPTPTPTGNGAKIAAKAKELCWPYGTPTSKSKWKGGGPTAAYKAAVAKYKSKIGGRKARILGCSCDVFVGVCVRESGVDSSFPFGNAENLKYFKTADFKKKWTATGITTPSKLQPGDVIFWNLKGAGAHICIFVGKSGGNYYYAEAGLENYYAKISRNKNLADRRKRSSYFEVFRAK